VSGILLLFNTFPIKTMKIIYHFPLEKELNKSYLTSTYKKFEVYA